MSQLNLMSDTLAQKLQAQHIGDVVCIHGVGTLADGQKGEIGFLADSRYAKQLHDTQLSAVIVDTPYSDLAATQLVVSDVRHAWRILCEEVESRLQANIPVGIASSARIDSTATIGEGVRIGEGVVIEAGVVIGDGVRIEPLAYIGHGVRVGDHSRIGAGVKVLTRTTIGKRCNILANAVIGERGFGNSFEEGRWIALPQLGGVRIGDDVEIGAATMIDRGAVGDTIIGNGVKLDNLIQIAHNVEIGEHTAMAGCCVVAGSVKIGRYCVIGGGCVFNGHISICDKVHITGHSSISKSITEPDVYSSAMPAMAGKKWKILVAKLRMFGREK